MLRRSIRPLPALCGVHHSFFSVRADWYLIPSAWIFYFLSIPFRRDLLPEFAGAFPWLANLSQGLWIPLLYLVWRQGKFQRLGIPLSRRDWLIALWLFVVGVALAFNVVVLENDLQFLLGLGFVMAGTVLFGITTVRLFDSGGVFRARRHPKGHPIPDPPRKPGPVRQRSERWIAIRGRMQRWGGRAVLAAGMAGAIFLWCTRSADGPYVPAEFGVGSPIRPGENIVDVMTRRGARVGEYGGMISETIDGLYFQEISYRPRYAWGTMAFGPVSSIFCSFERFRHSLHAPKMTIDSVVAICRNNYGAEWQSRRSYWIRKGSIDTEYVYITKTWKIDEIHSAAVMWREDKKGEGKDLAFFMGEQDETMPPPGGTVDVNFIQREPVMLDGDTVGYSYQ